MFTQLQFMQLRISHTPTAVSHSLLSREHTFSSFINVLILLCVIFLTYTLSVTVLTWWVASPNNGAETNCGIARILGILLMNSCDT